MGVERLELIRRAEEGGGGGRGTGIHRRRRVVQTHQPPRATQTHRMLLHLCRRKTKGQLNGLMGRGRPGWEDRRGLGGKLQTFVSKVVMTLEPLSSTEGGPGEVPRIGHQMLLTQHGHSKGRARGDGFGCRKATVSCSSSYCAIARWWLKRQNAGAHTSME
jgi:hypothetical protein